MHLANCNPPLWVRPRNNKDHLGVNLCLCLDRSLVDPRNGNYQSSRKRHSMPLVITAFVSVAILIPVFRRF